MATAESPAAEVGGPLVLETTIPLPDVRGRIDHLAFDLGRNRLIVAELGNGSVDIIDIATGKLVYRIAGLAEPQGVGYSPGADLIAVASAGDGSVRLFKGGDFTLANSIALGSDADDVRVDPRSGAFLVGYGEGGLAVIDPVSRAKTADIPLPAHPEGFQLDPTSGKVFVNIPDKREIAVVNLAERKQIATWPTADLRSNFPMAIDAKGTFVATVFRSPARLVLIDTGTGMVGASADTCSDADDVFFDDKRTLLYVSCGSGSIDVFRGDASDIRRVARIATSSGARTSLFVPERDRLFVAIRAGLIGSNASILVFAASP